MLKASYLLGGIAMLGLIFFLFSLMQWILALVWAGACGGIGFFVWRNPDGVGTRTSARGSAALMSSGACLLGALASLWTGKGEWRLLWGVPIALLVTLLLFFVARWGRGHLCRLCQREEMEFHCPRCSRAVCAHPHCWISHLARCADCHRREVPLLPIDDTRWWQERFVQAVVGQCDHCHRECRDLEGWNDLRECGQCRWPYCRRCWDYNNGRCPRCGWMPSGLPPTLKRFRLRASR